MFPEEGVHEAKGGAAWPVGAVTICGAIVSGAGSTGESGSVALGRPAPRDVVTCGLGDKCGARRR